MYPVDSSHHWLPTPVVRYYAGTRCSACAVLGDLADGSQPSKPPTDGVRKDWPFTQKEEVSWKENGRYDMLVDLPLT